MLNLIQGRPSRASLLTTTASFIALLTAMPAGVQAADAPQTAQEPSEEIVVTGSRIIRNGYEAPTPVTVIGIEQLQDSGKANIADVLNEMPAFQGSTTMATSAVQTGTKSGFNSLNLRNLNTNRALILFDGRRVPPGFIDGSVDVNFFPDALISRVDVVTGGASAVYGSDAVAGVVNFVLDTTFTGVKGSIQGNVSGHGDARGYKVQLAAGVPFAGDKGHFLVSGDFASQDPLDGHARAWNVTGEYGILNPAYTASNGLPQYVYRTQVAHSAGYAGGIIASGPLKGIAFGPGGTPFQFNYGTDIVNASYFDGGPNWQGSTQAGSASLLVGSNTTHLFAHTTYDVTDNIQVYAEFTNGGVKTNSRCCFPYYLGSLTIHPDNPYLPSSVANAILANPTAYPGGNVPFGEILHFNNAGFGARYNRVADIYTLGAKGNFDAFDTRWKWDAYVQRGISKNSFWVPYQSANDNFNAAIDAVRAPNGSIVCRSTLTNPNNGCTPYNLFGIGVNTQAAFDYINGGANAGGPHASQTISQNVAGLSTTGEPFSDWAGPVSLALSGEYRKDAVNGINDALSPNRGWFSTQLTSFPAHNSVVEGAAETLIPLAKGESWAKSLDLNAAVRFTDYEASGFVTTWKAGLTYNPINDVRLRFTQSRDIRAPTLADLFSTPQTNHNTIADPFNHNGSYAYFQVAQGNPNLKPEKADTTGLGMVYQPSWFSGFSASVDFYRINIKGAIQMVAYADVLNKCFAGDTSYCADVHRNPDGTLDSIYSRPQNQARQLAKGVDYEASYQTAMSDLVSSWDGNLNLRIVATNTLNLITDTGIAGTTQVLDAAGTGSVPSWSFTSTVAYSLDRFRITWTGHFISKMIISNTRIECTSNCPNIAGFTTVDKNHDPAYFISSLGFNYRFYQDGRNNADAFFTVDNLFDKDPPTAPGFGGTTYGVIANTALYDTIGRMFHAGIRFRM